MGLAGHALFASRAMSSTANGTLARAAAAFGTRADVAWWGMLVFLLDEGTLFATLIATYFFLAVPNASWPPPGIEKPSLPLPLLMTGTLLSSSAILIFGERGLARGNRLRYRLAVPLTVLLGLTFLGMQISEYAEKLKSFGPTGSTYGSIFFTITGLHGAHVAFGTLFLLWALTCELRGAAKHPSAAISNASLYWHFVDGVWLVIVFSLYISPRWM